MARTARTHGNVVKNLAARKAQQARAGMSRVLGSPSTMTKISLLLKPRDRARLAATGRMARNAMGRVEPSYTYSAARVLGPVMEAARAKTRVSYLQGGATIRTLGVYFKDAPFPIAMWLELAYWPDIDRVELRTGVDKNEEFDTEGPRVSRYYRQLIRGAREDVYKVVTLPSAWTHRDLQNYVEREKHRFRGYAMKLRVHEHDPRVPRITALARLVARPSPNRAGEATEGMAGGWRSSARRAVADRAASAVLG